VENVLAFLLGICPPQIQSQMRAHTHTHTKKTYDQSLPRQRPSSAGRLHDEPATGKELITLSPASLGP